MLQLAKLKPRLGKTFIDRLTSDIILKVGNSQYSRDDLVRECKVGNFGAARRLGRVLEDLGIESANDLARLSPEDLAAVKGVGETTVFVLLCVQDHMRITPLEFETTWTTQRRHAKLAKKDPKRTARSRKRSAPKPSRRSIREQTERFNEQQPTQ